VLTERFRGCEEARLASPRYTYTNHTATSVRSGLNSSPTPGGRGGLSRGPVLRSLSADRHSRNRAPRRNLSLSLSLFAARAHDGRGIFTTRRSGNRRGSVMAMPTTAFLRRTLIGGSRAVNFCAGHVLKHAAVLHTRFKETSGRTRRREGRTRSRGARTVNGKRGGAG